MPWHSKPVCPRPVLARLVNKSLANIEYYRFDHPCILQYVRWLTAVMSYTARRITGRI
jgi:hypothetical protein